MLSRIGVVVGLVGCAAVPETSVVPQALCSGTVCGYNSPEIAQHGFHELNLDHQKNAEGFVLLGASLDHKFYDLDVADSAIALVDAKGGRITGSKLAGATLWIANGRDQYGVTIDSVTSVAEMAPPNNLIDSYVLAWHSVVTLGLPGVVYAGYAGPEPGLGVEWHGVCPLDGPWNPDDLEWDESAHMAPFNAVVFEGDRIDDVTRTVDPKPDDRWFNIGCVRHTLSKLRLTRNTIHTVAKNGWQQVQAMIKMYSADYCGKGFAFTITGEPLVWRNLFDLMKFATPPTDLEARWDENGVTCLYDPRLRANPNPELEKLSSDIWQGIKDNCGFIPPKCMDPDPDADHGELIVSANY